MERDLCLQNGVVLLADKRNITPQYFTKFGALFQVVVDVEDCMPIKIRARHMLLGHNPPIVHVAIQTFLSFFNLATKKRIVVHARALEDNLEELSTKYGIKADILPVDLGGTVDSEYFIDWLEERRAAGI
uniref:CRAL-TRIO domain-containing protein n=1 Tax=Odontella aurita TaxID=265563 RepID=A0A7S4MWL4_9STRA|mmetsp:Transcript_35597/g.106220  ORF Transcript_35597/g.106220 Transcript_35597/m.106220 type:complete len:130 (+) Transcript_35597:47-436(+)